MVQFGPRVDVPAMERSIGSDRESGVVHPILLPCYQPDEIRVIPAEPRRVEIDQFLNSSGLTVAPPHEFRARSRRSVNLRVEVVDHAGDVPLQRFAGAVVVPRVSVGLQPPRAHDEHRRLALLLCGRKRRELLGAVVDPVAVLVRMDRVPRGVIEDVRRRMDDQTLAIQDRQLLLARQEVTDIPIADDRSRIRHPVGKLDEQRDGHRGPTSSAEDLPPPLSATARLRFADCL